MAETLNWRQMGPTSDLPVATTVGAGDRLIIETADGYKYLDYATLLSSQTVDLGDLGEGFGSGIGNLSLRHVPTDYVADGEATAYGLVDASNVAYTPAPGDVVLAFVGGMLDVTVVPSGSTVTFSDPPPAGERIRLCVFSPVAGTNTAALDDRYVQLLAPAADGYVLKGNSAGGLANAGFTASSVLTTAVVGVNSGVASLNSTGVVPTAQLPAAALLGSAGDTFAENHPADLSGHPEATNSTAGFMSAADKAKLDNLPNTANLNTGVTQIVMNGSNYTGSVEVNYSAILAAPLASPGLTGTPTAPNAAAGTNTDQIATTAFVQGEKVNTALTGTPTAPTAANGTATTQIATTAFVTNAILQENLGQYATNSYINGAFQPLNATLTNVAASNTNGFFVLSDQANSTVVRRTLVAGNGITITNTDGVNGNPVISADAVSTVEITRTPVAFFTPATAFSNMNIVNVPVTGVANPTSSVTRQYMDLSNITAVDFHAIIATAGSTNTRIGPRFSVDTGTTWRDATGGVINSGAGPADEANTTVAANATGQVYTVINLDATVRTTNTLVSFFACNGNGTETVQAPAIRVSAPAVALTGQGGGTWGTIEGTLSAQGDLQAALDAKLDDSQLAVAGGVASLNAAGKVPPEQLPAFSVGSSYGVFDASDPQYAGGLTPGSGNAVHNNAVYDALFAAARGVTHAYIILPPGLYYVSESVSPSGKTVGTGPNMPKLHVECRNHEILFQASSAYMDVRRGSGTGSLLSAFTPKQYPTDNPVPNDGRLFTGAGYAGVNKKVALNLRACGFSTWTGKLFLTGTSALNLVAVGSSGTGEGGSGGFFLKGADMAHIDISAFDLGFHAMAYGGHDVQVDPTTNLHIGHYRFVAGANGTGAAWASDTNSDATRIDHYEWAQKETSYIVGCRTFHMGTGFLSTKTPSIKFAIVPGASTTLHIDGLYVHQNGNEQGIHNGIISMGTKSSLKIGHLHEDRATGFIVPGTAVPSAMIFVGKDETGTAAQAVTVHIGTVSQQTLADSATLDAFRQIVALDCTTGMGTRSRRVKFDNFNDVIGTTPLWKPVIAVSTTGAYAATTNDICDVGFHTGRQQFRFNNGAFTTVASAGLPGGY